MSELGPEARALLEAARGGDDPTPADRVRVRRALVTAVGAGVALAATTTSTAAAGTASAAASSGAGGAAVAGGGGVAAAGAGTAAAAAGASSVGLLATKIVVTVAVVGGLGLAGAKGVHVYHARKAAQVAATAIQPALAASTAPEARNGASAAPDVVSSADTRPPQPPTTSTAMILPPPAANPAPKANPAPSTLEEETRLLRDADASLRTGDATTALARLDEHAARFPNGILSEERAAERVLALCSLGRTTEARADADRFLRDRPRSPLAARVRTACNGGDSR